MNGLRALLKKKQLLRNIDDVIGADIKSHQWLLLACSVLILLSQVARLALPWSTKYLIDAIVMQHQMHRMPILLTGVLFSILIHLASYFLIAHLMSKFAEDVISTLRTRLHSHLSHLPVAYYENNRIGGLTALFMSDVEGIRNLVGTGMLDLIGAVVISAITLVTMLTKSLLLTAMIMGVQCVAAAGLRRAFGFSRPIESETGRMRADLSGRLTESFGGIRTVKGYCAEDRENLVIGGMCKGLRLHALKSRYGFSAMNMVFIGDIGLSSLLVMSVGGYEIIRSRWTPGDFFQYYSLLAYLIGPIYQMVNLGTQLTYAMAGLDRVHEVFSERVEGSEDVRITRLPRITGDVCVEGVYFGYEPSRDVLHDISFNAKAGTATAIVGHSGSGKTTLMSLLCAFHDPRCGRILVDGRDIGTVDLKGYRAQLGLVLQETFLFDGTLRENVVFSRPGCDEDAFREACRAAYIDEFVQDLPHGVNTVVGERGVKLSGGQRQRISIARAILADPRILILDEATSSLDSESEAMVQEGLNYLKCGRTTFIVAHRMSTIRKADQILVLRDGRICERGTHNNLYDLRGRYFDMCMRQERGNATLSVL